jgi:hypothetical protein
VVPVDSLVIVPMNEAESFQGLPIDPFITVRMNEAQSLYAIPLDPEGRVVPVDPLGIVPMNEAESLQGLPIDPFITVGMNEAQSLYGIPLDPIITDSVDVGDGESTVCNDDVDSDDDNSSYYNFENDPYGMDTDNVRGTRTVCGSLDAKYATPPLSITGVSDASMYPTDVDTDSTVIFFPDSAGLQDSRYDDDTFLRVILHGFHHRFAVLRRLATVGSIKEALSSTLILHDEEYHSLYITVGGKPLLDRVILNEYDFQSDIEFDVSVGSLPGGGGSDSSDDDQTMSSLPGGGGTDSSDDDVPDGVCGAVALRRLYASFTGAAGGHPPPPVCPTARSSTTAVGSSASSSSSSTAATFPTNPPGDGREPARSSMESSLDAQTNAAGSSSSSSSSYRPLKRKQSTTLSSPSAKKLTTPPRSSTKSPRPHRN